MKYRLASFLTITCCGDQKYQCKILCANDEPDVQLVVIDYVYNHENRQLSHVTSTPEALVRLIQEKHEKEQVREIFDLLYVLQTKRCKDMDICFPKVEDEEIVFTLAAFDQIRVKYRSDELSVWDRIRGYHMVKGLDEHSLGFFKDLMDHPKVRLKRLLS